MIKIVYLETIAKYEISYYLKLKCTILDPWQDTRQCIKLKGLKTTLPMSNKFLTQNIGKF